MDQNIPSIEICVTSSCNLNCKHCYQSDDKNKYALSIEDIEAIVQYAHVRNCRSFILSGGEFFCHKDAYEILDLITNKYGSKVTCVSNLTLVDLEKICKISKSSLQFSTSIDGSEINHDDRRGMGTYRKTHDVMKKLSGLGFTVNVNTTLINDNIGDIPEILSDPLYRKVTFLPVAFAGEAKENYVMECDSEDYYKIISYLYRKCGGTCGLYNNRCRVYPKSFAVDYKGDVYPCTIARDYQICKIGNIHENSIDKVIELFDENEDSRMFYEYVDNNQILECKGCSAKNCLKGCRMRQSL